MNLSYFNQTGIKLFYVLLLSILLGSCSNDSSTNHDKIKQNETKSATVNALPFNGRLYKKDISKYYLIVDSITAFHQDSIYKIRFNKITSKFLINPIFNKTPEFGITLNPDGRNCGAACFQYTKDTVMVIYSFGIDWESSLITLWKDDGSDSIKYLNYLENSISTKNSALCLLETVVLNNSRCIIANHNWAEGGDYDQTIQLARIINNRFIVLDEFNTSGDSSTDTMISLTYKIKRKRVDVYEKKSVGIEPPYKLLSHKKVKSLTLK